jgi:hypothetical protein
MDRLRVTRAAAKTYVATAALAAAFQLALAMGAPWGAYAMGGVSPGQFSAVLRIGAVIQALLIVLMAGVVLARAGIALAGWRGQSRWLIWLVVGMSSLTLALNLLSRSPGERWIWVPVALIQLVSSFAVAIGK